VPPPELQDDVEMQTPGAALAPVHGPSTVDCGEMESMGLARMGGRMDEMRMMKRCIDASLKYLSIST